jgi:hypothetical protein
MSGVASCECGLSAGGFMDFSILSSVAESVTAPQAGIQVLHTIDTNVAKLFMTPLRDASISSPNLTEFLANYIEFALLLDSQVGTSSTGAVVSSYGLSIF